MDNAEEILQALEEFSKLKPKDIPKELDEYLGYVAKTGDPVYQWQLVKHLFHEKLTNVIKDFYETSPTIDLPPCPNVDPFNYERLKTSLLERLDMFPSAPFTVQRICELLMNPRKQYNRVDKFMRAIEKNILVVSTREPGIGKRLENDQTETVLNGVPDNKVNESADRIMSVCSDNIQFSNSTDSTQIPVENAVNACVIQEEIEIENSVSASTTVITTETESWCETNENKKESDLDIKTDLVDKTEINNDNTTLPNSELIKKKTTLFTEKEISNADKSVSDSILCNEPIDSSTPDSPESPEPSSSENVCDTVESLSDESVQPEPIENEDSCSDIKENEDEDNSETLAESSKSIESLPEKNEKTTEDLLVSESSSVESTKDSDTPIVEEQVIERDLKTDALSPEHDVPDSSNDSYHSSDADSKETNLDIQIEDDTTNHSSSCTEQNNSTEISELNTLETTENTENETTVVESVVKESEEDIGSTVEEKDDNEVVETKCEVTDKALENIVAVPDTVAASGDSASIKDLPKVKELIDETSGNVPSNVESTNEILDDISDDQDRQEGSIIHATPNISGTEVPNESQMPTSSAVVEDICVDQTSCSTEDEAMDVDESSNHLMITSEGENEVEPMDQSDLQTQS